jgi:hypothetical protein
MATTERYAMSIRGTRDRGVRARVIRLVVGLCAASVLTLAFTARGEASIHLQSSFGSSGSGAGQFNTPGGLAVSRANGDVYVVDRGNNRVEEFTETGAFVRAWGYDVVASGIDNKPNANELQLVRINGSSGTFKLSFKGQTTTAIPYGAPEAEVQTKLNELSTINTGGGSVSVSGSGPYEVSFNGGPLAGTNQPPMTVDRSDLGVPVGTVLNCGIKETGEPPNSLAYQWLANGVPIPAATSATYTTAAGDAGKVVQCRVSATFGQRVLLEADREFHVVSAAPGTAPPVPPAVSSLFNLGTSGSFAVGSAGGATITCTAGTWTGAPTEYTYRMFRNGQEVGSPVTTAATSNVYTVTTADLESPAVFQCSVTGINAGGQSTYLSRAVVTNPSPNGFTNTPPEVTVTEEGANSGVSTKVEGGAVFEVCKANPPSTDVCKAGVSGGQIGQFNAPRGVAVDNSAGGSHDVYVVDDNNFRVQKFTAEGEPLLTIGWHVDKTTGGDICTVASGDICGAGQESNSGVPGRFGKWPTNGSFEELGDEVAVDSTGDFYVADARENSQEKPAIEKFDPAGNFVGQAIVPTLLTNPGFFPRPVTIAVGPADVVYASISTGEGVQPFAQSLFTLSGEDGPGKSGAGTLDGSGEPTHVAIDPRTNLPLIVDTDFFGSICGSFGGFFATAIILYEPDGEQLDCQASLFGFPAGLGMGTDGQIYASMLEENKVDVLDLPMEPPTVSGQSVGNISTESAVVSSEVDPGYEVTEYGVEYGPADCSSNSCETAEGGTLKRFAHPVATAVALKGLEPGVKYHYRVVATNGQGTKFGPDRTFVTYPFLSLLRDPCPNALARQQTGSAGLFDCRAYELVSAEFTGGYDVESSLIAGQTPFEGYPDAAGKVLYAVHGGGIPGAGNPTNRGRDPYVATRNPDGTWSTEYVGIPANDPFASAPFSSTLYEADPGLDTFAYAGPEICAPCFVDGSSGIPVHEPDGSLTQGMKGSITQISAAPSGFVGKRISADGSHLVFGSTSKLEPAGNNGTVSIYDRNLSNSSTQVVSTMPNGSTMSGEVGELDMSENGSRVVVGKGVSTDAAGNHYWHPYMHIGTSSESVDLAPGTSAGVLYAGMSADGSEVFFTTTDALVSADEDTSADLYEAEVGPGGGPATLRLLSGPEPAPAAGNVNGCDPTANADGNNWNAVGGASPNTCGVVAVGGGGGVASDGGAVYFLSPEAIGGEGSANQPNLFVVQPGNAPQFVATLEAENPLVRDSVKDSEVHHFGDFQTTSDGEFAAFTTKLPLDPSYNNAGFGEVYRYGLDTETLNCVSCIPTEAPPTTSATLPVGGLGLDNEGRVFFNSREQLTAVDKNGNQDAYEWKEGRVQLISTGTSPNDVSLLGVDRGGADVYFFTRDTLVPNDHNGQAMKIYDAREEGGRFVIPPEPPCAASDECHGPGTQAAPPPSIGTFRGTGGQAKPAQKCRKHYVRRHGKCVKQRPRHRRARDHHIRSGR